MSVDLGLVPLIFYGSVPRICLPNKISKGDGKYVSIGVDLRERNAMYESDLARVPFLKAVLTVCTIRSMNPLH